MKSKKNQSAVFVLIAATGIIVSLLVAGCSSPPGTEPPVQVSAPLTTPVPASIPATSPVPVLTQAAATAGTLKTFTDDSYRLSVSYPADWEMEQTRDLSLRDYGQYTRNIVNFYSPASGSVYSVFSIDIDQDPDAELDDYYNHAVLALQDSHGSIDVTKHMSNWKISGSNAYRIDFAYGGDTSLNQRAVLVVTAVNDDMYIITFKGSRHVFDDNLDEAEAMMKSIAISSKTDERKHR